VLASTASSVVERLPDVMYAILDGKPPPPPKYPTAAQLAPLAGSYELSGTKLKVVAEGNRLYLEGPGEPRHRLAPVSEREFWIEVLQSRAAFDRAADKVTGVRFGVGDHVLAAPRVEP